MNFSESIIYIVLFVIIINILDFLKLRWKAGKIDDRENLIWEFRNNLLVIIGLLSLVLFFVFYSCYYAYRGFSSEYTTSMSLVGTVPFLVGGLVILRRSVITTLELQKKKLKAGTTGDTDRDNGGH